MNSGETSVYVHPYRLQEVFSMDLQKYEHDPVFIFHKSWWTDEGYVQRGLDRETNEEIERLVPFSDIKEVLIGPAWIRMHARSRDSSGKKSVQAGTSTGIQSGKQRGYYLPFLSVGNQKRR